MKLAGTEYTLSKKSFDIFVSGCTRNCPGCFNPEAQDFEFGETLVLSELLHKITENKDIIDTVRIMGGDLLCGDLNEASVFSSFLTGTRKRLELYTGAEFKDIPDWCFLIFDAIKYGPYIQELHCENSSYGSSNQKYIVKGVDY